MTYYFIERAYIPEDYYLCFPSNYNKTKKDWNEIQMFVFENGLEYYVGCNSPIREVYEGVAMLKDDFDMVSQFENASDLQQYYHDDMELYKPYKDCEKIWNYYNKNKELILEVIEEYKEQLK
jgi:hypothetical protein